MDTGLCPFTLVPPFEEFVLCLPFDFSLAMLFQISTAMAVIILSIMYCL